MYSAPMRRWLLGPVLCAAVIALLCGTAIRAHEIGTTRVSVLFHEGRTYDIEIATDAAALVEKLESSAGQSSPFDIRPAGLQSLLTSFDETFRQRVKIAFDASDVRPSIAYAVASGVDSASAAVATIRLTGRVPPDARHFTWTYGWTFASYAVTVRSAASENPATEWLEGGQSSAQFALRSPAPPVDRLATARRYLTLGFTHIVPKGLDHMLFVLGIYLLSSRARSVLWQVTAFTVAHSITLGLSMYGVVALSPRIVEPLIALSIAYVAIENMFLSELKSWRVAPGVRVRSFARHGFRGRTQGARTAALGICDSAVDLQYWGRGGATGGDRHGVHARRMALRQSRLVSQPYRRSRVDADRVHSGVLDDRAAVLLSTCRGFPCPHT